MSWWAQLWKCFGSTLNVRIYYMFFHVYLEWIVQKTNKYRLPHKFVGLKSWWQGGFCKAFTWFLSGWDFWNFSNFIFHKRSYPLRLSTKVIPGSSNLLISSVSTFVGLGKIVSAIKTGCVVSEFVFRYIPRAVNI